MESGAIVPVASSNDGDQASSRNDGGEPSYEVIDAILSNTDTRQIERLDDGSAVEGDGQQLAELCHIPVHGPCPTQGRSMSDDATHPGDS